MFKRQFREAFSGVVQSRPRDPCIRFFSAGEAPQVGGTLGWKWWTPSNQRSLTHRVLRGCQGPWTQISLRLRKPLSCTCQGKENEGVHLQWKPEIDPSTGHASWLFTMLGLLQCANEGMAACSCFSILFASTVCFVSHFLTIMESIRSYDNKNVL